MSQISYLPLNFHLKEFGWPAFLFDHAWSFWTLFHILSLFTYLFPVSNLFLPPPPPPRSHEWKQNTDKWAKEELNEEWICFIFTFVFSLFLLCSLTLLLVVISPPQTLPLCFLCFLALVSPFLFFLEIKFRIRFIYKATHKSMKIRINGWYYSGSDRL